MLKKYPFKYRVHDGFYKNVQSLRKHRPDFWLEPNETGFKICGELANDVVQTGEISNLTDDVTAINSSIILQSFAYIESVLEHVLVEGLGDPSKYQEPIKSIMFDYQKKIIRCSRFDELKNFFLTIYGMPIKSLKAISAADFEFVERFYVVRHLLAHGSTIQTEVAEVESGIWKFFHSDNEYELLMALIGKRFDSETTFHCELAKLMMVSPVVDDFSESVIRVCQAILSAEKQ